MKLTGTNSSIGLIILIACIHQVMERQSAIGRRQSVKRSPGLEADSTKDKGLHKEQRERTRSHPTADCRLAPFTSFLNKHALCRPGGYSGVAAPVPIPNTAVKRPSANGTSSQDAGE